MKKNFIVITAIIIFLFSVLIWWNNGIKAVNPQDDRKSIFVIEKGQGIRDIAQSLHKKKFVKDPVVFFLLIKKLGFDGKIQAGDFRLSPSMTAREIAENLTHGTLDIWITIPEGKRAEEIAEILKANIPNFNDAWKNRLSKNEGYLFPDTYLIPKDADIEMVINQMRVNFDIKYATLDTTHANLTQKEIVIIASLIEREAITDTEKPIIAGILLNRIDAGIPLQVDATIQYAKGKNSSNKKWWESVTLDEYKSVVSDYNTYLFTGLPPGPISNPGLEALRAAASPTDTDYLYYLHDKDRRIRYGKTLEEHNANIKNFGL